MYFINDETEYTSYSIKNYNEISHLKNFNKMERLNVFRGAVFMNSFKMIETMFDCDLFTPISFTNSSIMNTQYYSKIEESITDLRYIQDNAKLVNEPKETKRKTEEENEQGEQSRFSMEPIFFNTQGKRLNRRERQQLYAEKEAEFRQTIQDEAKEKADYQKGMSPL